ncbi:MAG: ABC transporter permease [Treponema sp.]|nr:ABC transporter permease [Treponema sp.]
MEGNIVYSGKGWNLKKRIRNFAQNYAIVLMLIFLAAAVSIIQPKFFTIRNFTNILNQISVVGVLSCGMTFVILIGCIDLSVGSMISLAGIFSVTLVAKLGGEAAIILSVLLGSLIGIGTGSIVGAIRGRMGESFMVTYGMQSVLAAFALIVSGSLFMMVPVSQGIFVQIGKGLTPVYIFVVLVIVCQIMVTKTHFGRNLMFMGANPIAASLSGINVRLNTIIVFMLSGLISALSGVLLASRVMSANPQAGSGYELDAIASCVVGGISMKGGVGSFINTLIGVTVIGILGNSLNLLGVGSYMQMIVRGAVIAAAVAWDIYNKRER